MGWACLVPGSFWGIPEDVCKSREGVDMPEGGQRTVRVILEGILVLLKFENKLNTIIHHFNFVSDLTFCITAKL